MTVNVWALPAPLDVLAWCAVHLVYAGWWTLRTPTRNVAELGPGWVVAYWLAVWASWAAGSAGSALAVTVRRGNDVFEFDPNRRGGAWLGWAGAILRWEVAWRAYLAGALQVVGYSSFLALVAVGILWRWVPVILIGVVWWRWRASTRQPWWTGADDLVG